WLAVPLIEIRCQKPHFIRHSGHVSLKYFGALGSGVHP
ncbi:MAG: hypothetical protein ACJA04_000393, partial [Cellvibrionaceae bacterium]